MKYRIAFFVLFALAIAVQAQKLRKIKISGTVFYQNKYCGGIQPNAEFIKEYETKYQFGNLTFKLINTADTTKVFFIETNSQALFKAKIPSGTYKFYMTDNYDKLLKVKFKPDCLRWINSAFGVLEISKKNRKKIELKFVFGCNPCEPPRQ